MVNKKDQAKGAAKFIFGVGLTATSIMFYSATFAIGTTSAIVGASVVGVGFILQFLSKDSKDQQENKETKDWGHHIRRLGSVGATFGVGCMLSPGIGVGIAAEGLYQAQSGKPVSIMSSLSKSVYQTGVNFRKGIELISRVTYRTLKGNKNPAKGTEGLKPLESDLNILSTTPTRPQYNSISSDVGNKGKEAAKGTEATTGGTTIRPPSSKAPNKSSNKTKS